MSTKRQRNDEIRRLSVRYPRVIEWSEEDRCYVGSAPPLVGQCCHGASEAKAVAQLAVIVEDLVQDVGSGRASPFYGGQSSPLVGPRSAH